uniref:14-3-3 protein n=1 Tax=Mimachlamys nobilis TaxID=106276 RepID=A0A8X8RHQ2_MIMNO|nr:14-3-3 protein [Mimachlamys nobilis]
MAEERHRLVYMAKITEQAERYKDMADLMKQLATQLPMDFPDTTEEYKAAKDNGTSTSILLDDERNLLSVAYKNIVGSRRNAWRVIDSSENSQQCKLDNGQDDEKIREKIAICQDYKKKVEIELNEICDEVTELLDKHLIKSADAGGAESKVFYLKMKGDYFRYKVEVASAENREELSRKSEEAYKLAWDTATSELKATHPIRLGLALNFSVFYYEIRNEPRKAQSLAKEAFDNGIKDMGETEEQSNTYKDSTLIMQLLRDNLALWTSESGDNDEQQIDLQDEN